jgi:serine/threonine-protein kinase
MIEKKVLTPCQAEHLLAGQADEWVVAGRYRVLEKLGEGGMGTVYKAHDTRLDRDVAVKVLPARSLNDADAIARFQREARALAKVSHPNIIQAYESGEDKGRHFLVMEYVEGVNLSAILRQQGAIPPTLAADLIYQAALGLQHAHAKGLVHRDLKPANLLLSPAQPLAGRPSLAIKDQARPSAELTASYVAPAVLGNGTVKILDLGLARFLQDQLGDAQLTREGVGVGTPDYMAPEQFRDALHADARTDIYGLGCTLYHVIGGTVPFPGSSFAAKRDAHANKEPIPLEERCPEVPAGLAFVVSKMMAKHPSQRLQTAAEVAEALAPYIAGASHSMIRLRQTMSFHAGQLTTRPPNRRKRLLAWSGAAAAAVCLVGLLILAWPRIFALGGHEPQNTLQAKATEPGAPAPDRPAPSVVIIENGLTVAKDGTGQYATIGEALANVQPGMTIRVLDDAAYPEVITVDNPERHAGVTLEAPRRATLQLPRARTRLLGIRDTPRVRVTGFRLREEAGTKGQIFVALSGHAPGVVLEDLDIQGSATMIGAVMNVVQKEDEKPVIVRRCSIAAKGEGIIVTGPLGASADGRNFGGILIGENRIMNASYRGVTLIGTLRRVLVVGNLVTGCNTGLQTQDLGAESEAILFANNTSYANSFAFRHWLSAKPTYTVPERQVELANNLLFAGDMGDIVCIDAVTGSAEARPDFVEELTQRWRFTRNWRDLGGAQAHMRIPLAPTDEVLRTPDGLSRDLNNPAFLRPTAVSPLANGGAGGDLPRYVGAVPPQDLQPWEWQKVWDARARTFRQQGE